MSEISPMKGINGYGHQLTREDLNNKRHRNFVGGFWEELGKLQFDFLKYKGLRPEHTLVDIGCGCLRGGVHYISYLKDKGYYGIDVNQSLIDAGKTEIVAEGLSLKDCNLYVTPDFNVGYFKETFDYALSFSLFTHLNFNLILKCLINLKPHLKKNGQYFATFFIVGESERLLKNKLEEKLVTYFDKDPYHYTLKDVQVLADLSGYYVEECLDFTHPRKQRMFQFTHIEERNEEELGLEFGAGDPHYRAYVGPPKDYDLVAAMTFNLLTSLGLKQHNKLIDIGCGSLRLGRLFIPYLNRGNYLGVEPNKWLVEEGVNREVGQSLVHIKNPRFIFDSTITSLDKGFSADFVVAQSIFSHCSLSLIEGWLAELYQYTSNEVVIAATFIVGNADFEGDGWVYPGCVSFTPETIAELANKLGFEMVLLDWFHPRQQWFALVKREYQPYFLGSGKVNWNLLNK